MTTTLTTPTCDDPVERARRVVAARGLRVVDLAVGAFGVVLPSAGARIFLRLARAVGGPIDRARAVYLLRANTQLRVTTGGWIDGPGVVGDCSASGTGGAEAAALRAEIEAIAPAIRALGENERFARAYLELHVGVATAVDDAASQEGSIPDLSSTPTQPTQWRFR